MFGSDRTVAVVLRATVSDYVGKMQTAKAATLDLAKSAESHATKHRDSWDKVGKGMIVAGAAIALGVGAAVKAYADFDKEMSNVRAVSGATSVEMKALSEAALNAGARTKFSASEAAQATSELAKVGMSTADILGGALDGALDLAAAGNLDLAQAAEIAGQTMKIFGLHGKDVVTIADALASGANKSAADVTDLSQALSQSGLQAAQTGLSMTDTVGVLALFADNALKGSDAGTSLKTMLARLNPSTKEAAIAMKDLGLDFFDAQGNFIGVEKAAGLLKAQLSGLTVEQRQAALQTIFGSDAIRAATVLYSAGADGVREYVTAVQDQGAAQRVAAIQMDNLAGDWEALSGSIETAFIRAGSAGDVFARGAVQAVTSAVNAFNDLPDGVQSATLAIAGVAGALLLAGGGFLTIVPKIAAAKTAMVELGITSTAVRSTLSGPWGVALALGAVALGAFAAKQMAAKQYADDLRASLDQQTGAITANTRALVAKELQEAGALRTAREAGVSLRDVTDAALGQNGAFERLAAQHRSAAGAFEQSRAATTQSALATGDLNSALLAGQSGLNLWAGESEKAGQASGKQAAALGYLLAIIDPTRAALGTATDAQKEIAEATGPAADGVDKLGGALDESAKAAQDAAKAYQEAQNAIEMMGGGVRAEQAALRSYRDSLADADRVMKDGKSTMDDRYAALDKIAANSMKVVTAQMDMGRGADEIHASMQQQRETFINVATALLGSRDMATQYADAMGLIPDDVRTQVEAVGAAESTAEVLDLNMVIKNLEGKTVTVAEAGADESNRRVLTLDGSIFGLDGKTVDVQEIGATASGERVVMLDGRIYKLQGKTVTITANTSQAMNAIAGVDGYLKLLDGRVARAYVNVATTYSGPQRPGGLATGGSAGLVVGPGTSTSDSVGPVMLSNREYVIKAAAVERYGVRLFDDLNAMRLASGGRPDFSTMRPAPATAYATRASVTTTASAAPLDPATIRAALDGATLRLGPVDSITREVTAQLVTAYSRSV